MKTININNEHLKNRRIFIKQIAATGLAISLPFSLFSKNNNTENKISESNHFKNVADNDAFVQINKLDHRYFQLSNNKTFIPIGPNICFPRFETEEEKVFELYERQLKAIHENGGNYTRIYLSAPFWEVEHEQAGKYDPEIVDRLKRFLGLAKKYQIKVKLCFEYFRTLDKIEPKFKNSISFGKHIYSKKFGGPLNSVSEFFDSEAGHKLFLNRIKLFSDLFSTNSQVFAWELWNEMNAVRGGNYTKWTETMLDKAHSLFPHSLIVQNLGSFDDDKKRNVYKAITTMPSNDYAQIHRYLDLGAKLEVCRGPIDVMASGAITELQKYVCNKPVILAETGGVEPRHAGPLKLYEQDKEGIILHDLLFAPFFSGSAGPGQAWHWQFYIDKNNLWWHYGRFSKAIKDFDPAVEKVVPIKLDQQHFKVYVLKGQNTVLIWIRDINTNWKTELVEKINAPVNQNITFDCWPMHVAEDAKVSLFDPWKGRWTKSQIINGKILLPDFIRSLVIKIES